jgi:glycerol dehydrogenase-like iron-containing ADH family enzyme
MTEYVYGKIDGIGNSFGKYAVMTMDIPWNLVKNRIGGTPVSVTMVTGLEHEYLDRVVRDVANVDTVVGIGGGMAIDAAKYFSGKRNCPLILAPTIVSVNAYATPMVAVREGGAVHYQGNANPQKVVIDYRAIQSAPKRLNTAGVGDVYSCRTALFDWKFSHDKTGESYDESIAAGSQRLLDKLISNADEIKNVTEKGIRTLVEAHVETNRLQQVAGKPRPEEGSEHILFYALEELTGRSFVHGEVVGTGIFVVTHLQTKQEKTVAKEMDSMGLMFRPRDYELSQDEFVNTILRMKTYSKQNKMFYSILDAIDISKQDAEKLWEMLTAEAS